MLIAGALLLLAGIAGKDYAVTWWLGQAMPGVRMTWAQLNPISGRLHIYGLDYREGGLHIRAPRLDMEMDLASLAAGRLNLPLLRLEQPEITMRLDQSWQTDDTLPIQRIHITDGRLTLLRASGPQGAPMRITANIRRADALWRIDAKLGIAGGTLHLTGDMDTDAGRFHAQAADISLAAMKLPALAGAQGNVSGDLDIRITFASSTLAMRGRVEATDVALRLPGQIQQQTARAIRVAGRFDSASGRWQLRSVRIDRPHLRLGQAHRQARLSGTHHLRLRIDAINVSGGVVDVMHRGPAGNTRLRLSGLRLAAHGLSAQHLLPETFSARGRLASGTFTARLQHGFISGQLTGIDLHRLDQLVLAATGHRVYSGKASAVLAGVIHRRRLEATARFDIANLLVGPRIPVRGADTSIPLRAAVASLTDIDGHTRFPVHIRGPVTAPSISVSRATRQAIGNTAIRSVGLPVTLLLRTLTDTPRVIHRAIGFRSADTQYSDNGERTIRELARMLRENPDMRLEIRGCAYPKKDGQGASALTLRKLAASRAQRVWQALVRRHVSPDRIRIVYPMLWLPSPHLGGLGPRVEVSLLPA